MLSCKIVAVLLLALCSQTECSGLGHAVAAPAVYAPAVRYGLVAPQNIRPFAAQVSTFTKGLNIYAAPYAAGVLGGPAIVSRALAPAPVYPAVATAPIYPAVASAPVIPAPAPYYPGIAPAPYLPAAPVAAPAHLLPAPFARSIHALAPGVHPGLGYSLPAAPLLG